VRAPFPVSLTSGKINHCHDLSVRHYSEYRVGSGALDVVVGASLGSVFLHLVEDGTHVQLVHRHSLVIFELQSAATFYQIDFVASAY